MRPLIALLTLLTATQPAFAKLEVHEWGTFTSLVGSNGVTQNGMYHEDEALPDFVHPFGVVGEGPKSPPDNDSSPSQPTPPSRPSQPRPCPQHSKVCLSQDFLNAQIVTQKMETPVIYFRSDVDQDVRVNVQFPKGVVTETYPAPVATSPTRDNVTSLTNGNTTFNVKVLANPTPYEQVALPFVPADNIYSHARNAVSNYVMSGREIEKFIFYRGIGQYQPTFNISSSGGALTVSGSTTNAPQVGFLIDVNTNGEARLMKLTHDQMRNITIGAKDLALLRDHERQTPNAHGTIVSGERASEEIVNGLVQAGLHTDEAQAMVATWERGYLKVPGLRLLSILPRAEVDSILPLTITPAPTELQRVFVSRIEILLDTEERQILSDIANQGSSFDITTLGRFAEPKLRRIYEVCRQAGQCNFCGETATRVALDTLIRRAQNPTEQSGSASAQ